MLCVLSHIVEHQTQVLQVDEQQAVIICNTEHDVEHAALRFVQLHQARQQLWTHLAHGRSHRVTALAIDIKHAHGATRKLRIGNTELGATLLDETTHRALLADTREVALHIGHKARNTRLREGLGQHLQRNGLTRTRRTGNQTVAVSHTTLDRDRTRRAVSHI